MQQIHTEIEIAAPPARVWEVLTDFAAYPAWNPLIVEAGGAARAGERLRIRVRIPGYPPTTFRPTVLAVELPRELRWRGRLLLPGLFDGEHLFRLEPLEGGRTRLVQAERFRGVLVPFFRKMLAATERGFEAMNRALRERAER